MARMLYSHAYVTASTVGYAPHILLSRWTRIGERRRRAAMCGVEAQRQRHRKRSARASS